MDSRTLGITMACAENNIRPRSFNKMVGVAEEVTKNPHIGRLLAKSAATLMAANGAGTTAPCIHLALISKQADWTPQCQEVVNDVIRCMKVLEPMEKKSMNLGDITGAAESAVKGIGYGTLGAGIGAGTLWWLLGRHAMQEDSKSQAMSQQIDYYNQLTKEIENTLRRKYKYDPGQSSDSVPVDAASRNERPRRRYAGRDF